MQIDNTLKLWRWLGNCGSHSLGNTSTSDLSSSVSSSSSSSSSSSEEKSWWSCTPFKFFNVVSISQGSSSIGTSSFLIQERGLWRPTSSSLVVSASRPLSRTSTRSPAPLSYILSSSGVLVSLLLRPRKSGQCMVPHFETPRSWEQQSSSCEPPAS